MSLRCRTRSPHRFATWRTQRATKRIKRASKFFCARFQSDFRRSDVAELTRHRQGNSPRHGVRFQPCALRLRDCFMRAARKRLERADLLDHLEIRTALQSSIAYASGAEAERRRSSLRLRTTFADILLDGMTGCFGNCRACAEHAPGADQTPRRWRRPVVQQTSGSFSSVSVPCRR
jgi:hypothetical protein